MTLRKTSCGRSSCSISKGCRSASTSKRGQRKVKAAFRTLIERTGWIVAIAAAFCGQMALQAGAALAAVALELEAYLPSMKKVAATARRARLEGETVPASQRVFSLFEQHTELIQRGRRQKPVEFGHAARAYVASCIGPLRALARRAGLKGGFSRDLRPAKPTLPFT